MSALLLKPRLIFIAFFLSVLLWGLFLPQAQAGLTDPKLKWYTISTKHFNIHYHNGIEESAFRLSVISEKTYQEIATYFKWKPWGRIEVVLSDTTDISNALATTLPYNYILILLTPPPGDSTLNYYDNWLEDIFRHELTHIIQIDMVGGIARPLRYVLGRIVTPNGLTPGWVREGIAVQQESLTGKGRANNSFSEMMLRTDILNDEFITIDQMSGNMFKWPGTRAPYIYGGMFWTYLAETYGMDKVREFSKRYSDSLWLFSLNNKARKTFQNKNFLKLKKEWEEHLKSKYIPLKNKLEAQGLTEFNTLQTSKSGSLTQPTLSHDGRYLIYTKQDYFKKPQTTLLDLEKNTETKLTKQIGRQYSFNKDNKKVVYSLLSRYKHYYRYYDLYELDIESKKSTRLTHGKRAFDPDYSPDGKYIVFVANDSTTTRLFLYELEDEKETKDSDKKQEKKFSKKEKETKEDKRITALTPADPAIQFSNPRFSPDGKMIAVSRWKEGKRDIILYDRQGTLLKQVTDDEAIDNHPVFSADGNTLFYSSDLSGITNLYRYDILQDRHQKITNVLTGVFQPQVAADKIYVQYYNGRGYDIRSFDYPQGQGSAAFIKDLDTDLSLPNVDDIEKLPHPSSTLSYQKLKQRAQERYDATIAKATYKDLNPALPAPKSLKFKKYNPFKKLFIPRFILPGFFFTDDTVILSANIGSSDPLLRHVWNGGITYRFDAGFMGGNFLYTYNRYWPTIFVSFNDFVVSYGDLFRIGQNFFEERTRGNVGVSLAGYALGQHRFSGYYFFENRSAESFIPPDATNTPTLGRFAGFGARYTFNRASKQVGDISLEDGPRLLLDFQASDRVFGSNEDNEQYIFSGDLREYIRLPLEGHVFALRAAGGISFGDRLLQGTFRLGSATGESIISGPTPRLFTLRGLPQITFAGERALLFSGEYRLPLAYPQRGAGTGPIFLKKLHMAFFADYGSVFNDKIDFNNFLLGVGAELRADLVLGYGLPVSARLGYGIIVVGREFIQGLNDPITGAAVTNGALILELGTSF